MWGAGVVCQQEFCISFSYKGAAEKAKRSDRANTIKAFPSGAAGQSGIYS